MAPSSESLLTVFDYTTTVRSPKSASRLVSFLFNLCSRNLALKFRLCPHVSWYFFSILQEPPFPSVHIKTISRRFQKSKLGTVFENLRFRCSKKPFTFGRKAKTEKNLRIRIDTSLDELKYAYQNIVWFSGSQEIFQASTKSFLFRFQRTLNRTFDEAVLGIEAVFKLIEWNINEGPTFGRNELVFSLDTRQALTEKLISYAKHLTDNETLLFGEYSTYLHDIEVLSIGGKS